jgi:hypothetical protein
MFPPLAPFFFARRVERLVGLPPGEARLRPRAAGHWLGVARSEAEEATIVPREGFT